MSDSRGSSEDREFTVEESEGDDLLSNISPPLVDFLSESLLNMPEVSPRASRSHRQSVSNAEASLRHDYRELTGH